MTSEHEALDDEDEDEDDPIVREIIELERSYFFERRNVKTERRRKLEEIIERHTPLEGTGDDS